MVANKSHLGRVEMTQQAPFPFLEKTTQTTSVSPGPSL